MASTTMLDCASVMAHLKDKMNHELKEAAEPVIKKAVEEAEKEIRKRVGIMIMSLLESSFDARRDGRDLIIRLELGGK